MGIGFDLVGEAAKRGLIARLPTAERLLADAQAWLEAEAHEAVRSTRLGDGREGLRTLFVALHPAADVVEIGASDAGKVTAAAVTSAAGPGYHTYVAQLLRRLGTDLEIAWAPADAETGTGDATGFFDSADRASAEQGMLTWLRSVLAGVRDARARGASGIQLSMPADTLFSFEGALATVLGPRDDAWLETAIDQPQTAIDVWPWFADATDARYLLNRALCLMWTEVRWRPPASDERALLDEVLDLLRRAHAFDPSLPYPWREWAELLALRGVSDSLGERIAERAAAVGADRPLVGYRRRPVTVVHEGWSLEVPGSFAERRSPEEVWVGEAGRNVTLAAVVTGDERGPMASDAFLAQVAGHLGDEALHHRSGDLAGRARLTVDASSGVEVAVVEGYSAVRGSGAAIRVVIEDPNDWEWALKTWRSLEHP